MTFFSKQNLEFKIKNWLKYDWEKTMIEQLKSEQFGKKSLKKL